VSSNNVTHNQEEGIWFYDSSDDNTVSGNNVTANGDGIYFESSSDNNTFFGNNITANHIGIYLIYSSGNTFYHNDFVNNTQQVSSDGLPNTWDNGYPSGGNYWSDYTGVDEKNGPYQNLTGSDGIGDTPYIIDANNTDRYPLMGPFHTFNVGTWNGVTYSVDVMSNSTIKSVYFLPHTVPHATLSFGVEGQSGTKGFCRVTIPLSLMSGEWTVTVNGTQLSPPILNITTYGNYTYIYFTYHHSTETVQITSTSAIPEFQPFMLLPLLMILTLLIAIVCKKKRNKSMVSGLACAIFCD
jgi:parallel beta-helix repeat protein